MQTSTQYILRSSQSVGTVTQTISCGRRATFFSAQPPTFPNEYSTINAGKEDRRERWIRRLLNNLSIVFCEVVPVNFFNCPHVLLGTPRSTNMMSSRVAFNGHEGRSMSRTSPLVGMPVALRLVIRIFNARFIFDH